MSSSPGESAGALTDRGGEAARVERLRRNWDRGAASYDRAIALVDRRYLESSRRWVCARALLKTLEIAIGTGLNLPFYGADVALTGVEFSPEMLRLAGERAARLGRPVELVPADAAVLPFADASFDTVVCTFGLCCVISVEVVLGECARVLRPGGRLLLADHVVSTNSVLRAGQAVLDRITVPAQEEHWTRRPRLLLAQAGFRVVEAERMTFGAVERVHAVRG